MFSGILLMSAKWYMIYCNGVIVMVCADGITITALQYFMPILKSSLSCTDIGRHISLTIKNVFI